MKHIHYVTFDPDGMYVQGGGVGPKAPEGAVTLPKGVHYRDAVTCMMVDEALVQRPRSPAPVQIEGGWGVYNCPEGTIVDIWDMTSEPEEIARVVTDAIEPNVEFSLLDVGTYEVSVTSPLPYLRTKIRVDVE